jgi:hypothetical protein
VAERRLCSRLTGRDPPMAVDTFKSRAALAEQNVDKGRRIVARQRQRIARLKARGGDCAQAEDLLSLFERSLAILEYNLEAVSTRARG